MYTGNTHVVNIISCTKRVGEYAKIPWPNTRKTLAKIQPPRDLWKKFQKKKPYAHTGSINDGTRKTETKNTRYDGGHQVCAALDERLARRLSVGGGGGRGGRTAAACRLRLPLCCSAARRRPDRVCVTPAGFPSESETRIKTLSRGPGRERISTDPCRPKPPRLVCGRCRRKNRKMCGMNVYSTVGRTGFFTKKKIFKCGCLHVPGPFDSKVV